MTQQIDAVVGDLRVDAVKTGMLDDRATVLAVVEGVRPAQAAPLVVDPVMVATSGDMLLQPEAVEAVRRELLPLADILTPNLPEAARLLDLSEAADEAEMEAQAPTLLALGAPRRCCSRAGMASGREAVDILVTRDAAPARLALPRIDTRNTHGTGCTLSAAIAAGLARGDVAREAVVSAKRFVHDALNGGPRTSKSGAARARSIICIRCAAPANPESQGPCRRTCGAAASTLSECDLAHLRATRASVTNLGNAVPRHRFQAPGGASGWRLGAPPDLAEEPVR